MEAPDELNHTLSRWLYWLRLRRAATWAIHGLAFSLAASFGIALLAMFRGWIVQEEFLRLVIWTAGLGLLAAGSGAALWPVSRMQAARKFDRCFHLFDRVSTALELASHPAQVDGASKLELGLRRLQVEDALSSARKVNPKIYLPIRIQPLEIGLVVLLLAGMLMSLRVGEPYFQAASKARSAQQAIAKGTARIEELQSQIKSDPSLNTDQQQALIKPLEEAAGQMEQAQSIEQAVSILSRAQEQLAAQAGSKAQQQAQNLREAGQQLALQAGSPLQQFGQKLASGDLPSAAQKLDGPETGNLTEAQRQELAQQLDELAKSQAEANPDLASQLQSASQDLRAGSAQAAQKQLDKAARAINQTGRQAAQSERAEQASNQVNETKNDLLQQAAALQGQNGSSAQGSADQGQTGAGGQQSSGAGQSQGNGQGSQGAGRGESSEESGIGPEAGTQPIQQNNGPNSSSERPYEQVYAPQRLGGQDGSEVTLPGSSRPGDQTVGQGNVPFAQSGQSQVPYNQVFQSYAEAYRKAIQSGQVPPQFQDLVRKYFSSLEP